MRPSNVPVYSNSAPRSTFIQRGPDTEVKAAYVPAGVPVAAVPVVAATPVTPVSSEWCQLFERELRLRDSPAGHHVTLKARAARESSHRRAEREQGGPQPDGYCRAPMEPRLTDYSSPGPDTDYVWLKAKVYRSDLHAIDRDYADAWANMPLPCACAAPNVCAECMSLHVVRQQCADFCRLSREDRHAMHRVMVRIRT